MRFPGFEGEWEEKKLGEIAIKINSGKTPLGGEKAYQASGVLFIRSQNVNNGRLELENPVFIAETTNIEMKNSIVQCNDILLNITGASLGRSCVVPDDFKIGNVNQHVCIIRLKDNNNPRLIEAIIASNKVQLKFKSLQTGSGREGLNFETIKSINLFLPNFEEQQKISSFLSSLDERILTQSKIIEGLKTFKATTAKKIFSNKLRFKKDNQNNFPDWKMKTLGEVLSYEQPTSYLVSSTEYSPSFRTPVITAGKTFILGFTNEVDGVFEATKLPVIIFDDFTTASQYVDFDFKAKSSAMKILKAKKGHNIKFLYEAMQMINYEVGGHGRHWISIFSQLEILLPTEEEQTIIAGYLSKLDNKIKLETTLHKELLIQKQFLLKNLFK